MTTAFDKLERMVRFMTEARIIERFEGEHSPLVPKGHVYEDELEARIDSLFDPVAHMDGPVT